MNKMTSRQPEQPLARAFEDGPPLFELLRSVRSRRVGVGYRIDSGASEKHPVTERLMRQEAGPNAFVSSTPPVRLTETEEALLAWAGCGPNGIVAWDVSLDGGFNQIADFRGRTAPEPNNLLATDLLIINDSGTCVYRPDVRPRGVVEPLDDIDGPYARVRTWYRHGRTEVTAVRPDIDWAMRASGAPNAPLNGPHQYNMNRPGATWFVPITDVGRLGSGLIDLFATRHAYLTDDFDGERPAGLDSWIGPGQLELPMPLSVYEQGLLRAQSYPAGCIVQNIRLAAEALGLGSWCFSGFDSDILLGARPELAAGLGFSFERNERAPVASGGLTIFGTPGVKTATCVPSPGYPSGDALVRAWHQERYGAGGWASPGENNLIRSGEAPWPAERADEFSRHPCSEPPRWAYQAAAAHIDYCAERYGRWPVTFNPMLAGFGVTVHHTDCDFYDRHYRPGYVTGRIRRHFEDWHQGEDD